MKFHIFVLCFIATNDVIIGHHYEGQNMTYVDEGVILAKIFSQLKELEKGIELSKSRYEENQKKCEAALSDSSIFDIRVDAVPKKCETKKPPRSCAEATACTQRSGIYEILLKEYISEPFLVECDVKSEGGGWTLIQRRQEGSVDFFRSWSEYKKGFGNVDGEFFIGLDKLHALTNYNGPQELLIVLEDKNEIKKAKYSNFVVGDESESYALNHLGVYSGDGGDSLTHHLGAKFTTKDRDNDDYESNCAVIYTGAWWYKKCHLSNLNGKYGDASFGKGITWHSFRGYNVSIQHVAMMIRRRTF